MGLELREKYKAQLLSEQKAAKELGITKKELRALIESGALSGVMADGKYMVTLMALESFINGEKNTVYGQQNAGLRDTNAVRCWSQETYEDEGRADTMVYTGSVSTLSDGRFMVQIDKGKSEDGKRLRESKSFREEEAAREYLADRLAELNSTEKAYPNLVAEPKELSNKETINFSKIGVQENSTSKYGLMTVRAFTNYYLGLGISDGTSRTKNGYKEDMTAVLELIGKMRMSEVREEDIRQAFNQLSQKYSQSVLDRKHTTCKRIFTYAYDKEYIRHNPFRFIKKKPKSSKLKPKSYKYAAFTEEELDRIITVARSHDRLYAILALLQTSGIRPGELRATEWAQVDFKNKTIRIIAAVTRKYEGTETLDKKSTFTEILSSTKSEYGERTLDLSDEAVDALRKWKRELEKDKNEKVRSSTFIFPDGEGSFMKEAALRSLLDRFIKRNHLEDTDLHLYKYRHTMCTSLILQGIPISIIMKIMGDNSPDVITDIYSHVYRKDVKDASKVYLKRSNEKYSESKERAS